MRHKDSRLVMTDRSALNEADLIASNTASPSAFVLKKKIFLFIYSFVIILTSIIWKSCGYYGQEFLPAIREVLNV